MAIDCNKMQISNILLNKVFAKSESKRPINYNWEDAKLFCSYCGVGDSNKDVVFVLKLFKQYGKDKVLSLQSWLKDNNCDKDKIFGLIVWRLKNTKKL